MKRYGKLFDSGHWLDAQWWYPEADFLQLGESYDAQGIAYNALAAELAKCQAELAMQKEILARYHKLNLAHPETPVSTLCAVCDQIKELHPNTHPWTPRASVAETKGDASGNAQG